MKELLGETGTILGGIGVLIFFYLVFNSQNTTTVAEGLATSGVNVISALQGRTNG